MKQLKIENLTQDIKGGVSLRSSRNETGTIRPLYLMTCMVYHKEQRHGHLTSGPHCDSQCHSKAPLEINNSSLFGCKKKKKRHSCLQHHITYLTFSVFPSLGQGSSSVRVSGWLIGGLHNRNWVDFNSWDLLYMHAEAFLVYFRLLKAFKCLISEYVCIRALPLLS